MGMATYEYAFSRALDQPFVDTLGVLGDIAFPLGRANPIVKIDVPPILLIEGIMGLKRLRITLRFGVEPDTARASFERVLAQATTMHP